MDRCFCKSHDKRLRRRPATNPLKHDLHTDVLPPNHETTGSIGDTPKMFRITRIVVIIVVIERKYMLTTKDSGGPVYGLCHIRYRFDRSTEIPSLYCIIDCDIANKPL